MSTPIKSLDFSGIKDFEACPQRFKWSRVDRKKPSVPENSYYAIGGIVKQKLFELMFNEKWYMKGKDCAAFMMAQAPKVFTETLQWARVDWNAPFAKLSREQMLEEIRSSIPKGIKMIKDHRLLSKESRSEVRLTKPLGDGIDFVGKVDFIIKHPNESYIIDGKDTADASKMKTNVDPKQLWVYSLLHKHNYGKYPDKVGFMYWRWDTIDYYDPVSEVPEIEDWINRSYAAIKVSKFEAKPSNENCFFCKYKQECPAYQATFKKYDDGTGVSEGEITF